MSQSLRLIIKMKAGKSFENTAFHKSAAVQPYQIEPLYKSQSNREAPDGIEGTEADFDDEEMNVGLDRMILLKFKDRIQLIEKLEQLEQSPDNDIEYYEEDEINHITVDPNDTHWSKLWNIKKIKCPEAWKLSKGENVIVAVIDTGIDLQHPDLISNLWKIKVSGKVRHGYDFVNNDNNPDDDGGHGTHVAGTIAAVLNNKKGVVGVAPKAQLMAVKGLNSEGNGYSSNLANCIRYAVKNGAKVINNSWGRGRGRTISEIIDYAYGKGCIVTFSAGNGNDLVTDSVAAGNTKVISVASVDKEDARSSTSNFGKRVDISAPGVLIYSTGKNKNYVYKSGTSMACPHVSGLIALILKLKPNLSFLEIKKAIQTTADHHYTERGKPIGSGRINAKAAVNFVRQTYSIQVAEDLEVLLD